MKVEEFIAAWNAPKETIEVQTSGSTGKPKLIRVEKSRMRASARMTCDALGLREGDTALLCMSVDYIAGKMMVVRALEYKLRLLTTQPDGHPLKTISDDIDLAAMVPLQVWNSLQVPEERERLRRIRHLLIGGGAIPPAMEYELRQFPNAVWSTYGMTETLSHVALRRLSGPKASPWYSPLPGIRLSQDPDTRVLVIDAPSLCPETLHTHDIVEFNDDRFRILGRTDNTINSGGMKIQIEEVEALLQQELGETLQVTSRPDPKFGEALILLTTQPIDEARLHDILRDRPYWYPKEIRHIDQLPLTATGKPDRARAKELAQLTTPPLARTHFPACFVELPTYTEGRRAAFYLAAEEYIADHLPPDDYFFTWQLGPTVVMGRNQVAHQEVDLDFCRREDIDVCRRRSGGGAIFADEGNIMTSLITASVPVEPLFREYAEAVAEALRSLGVPAQVSGRNDIVVKKQGERGKGKGEPCCFQKVCGNAFYQKSNHCIAHGTMLYDTNPRLMEGALHPDVNKLEMKGVKSVRSRIGLLKDHLSFGVETLRKRLRDLLCNRTVQLTDDDIHRIEELEQRYYAPHYLLGSTGHADIVRSRRIEGCGIVELHFSLQGSLIREVHLTGDFFSLADTQAAFHTAFTGLPFTAEALTEAVRTHHPERTIRGLSEADLMNVVKESS